MLLDPLPSNNVVGCTGYLWWEFGTSDFFLSVEIINSSVLSCSTEFAWISSFTDFVMAFATCFAQCDCVCHLLSFLRSSARLFNSFSMRCRKYSRLRVGVGVSKRLRICISARVFMVFVWPMLWASGQRTFLCL